MTNNTVKSPGDEAIFTPKSETATVTFPENSPSSITVTDPKGYTATLGFDGKGAPEITVTNPVGGTDCTLTGDNVYKPIATLMVPAMAQTLKPATLAEIADSVGTLRGAGVLSSENRTEIPSGSIPNLCNKTIGPSNAR